MSTLDHSLFDSAVPQTVAYVFDSMLSLSVESLECELPGSTELVTAALHFSGGWTGATLLEVPPDMARAFTSRMLGMDMPDRVDDDVIDAMGELVNMVGGNLKTILPPGVNLSLPSVVIGTEYTVRVCGGHLVNRWMFGGELGRFWASIIEVRQPGN
jgi:chemotaxis protein CheX